MKIAVITDIHLAPGDPAMLRHLEQMIAAAGAAGADLLLDLGDRIDDVDRATDLARLDALAAAFRRFAGARMHLLGNHDVVNLTAADHARHLGRAPGHHVHDLGEARLVLWEPPVTFRRPHGFAPARDDLPWLVDTLLADPRPAIIASHIPVSGAAMTGNYYFANNPSLATYPDAAAIRDAVAATGRAALWLSGHVHWNSLFVTGGLTHLTLQSPSETFTTDGAPALTWAMVTVAEGMCQVRIQGRDPLNLAFPFGPGPPWPAPRPTISG